MSADDHQQVILITGGTGFAGSHLVEHLLASHKPETIHVTSFSNNETFVHSLLPAKNIHQIDLRNQEDTAKLLQSVKPTQLYHLAAIAAVGSSFSSTVETFTTNFQLQFSLLESLRMFLPTTRTLVVGSAQEYDVSSSASKGTAVQLDEHAPLGPANPYGISKVSQDLLALSYYYTYKLPIIRVRPFNHIGERQELGFAIADFAHQIVQVERGEISQITVGNTNVIRDFSDVKDIVSGYQLLMEKGTVGEVYNIGSGQGESISSMLEALTQLATQPIQISIDQAKLRPVDVESIVANADKIKQLGWQPQHSIQETLGRVIEYWRNQQ